MNKLEDIGYSNWFQERTDHAYLANHELARVISVHKDRYVVTNGTVEVFAELSGKLFYTADSVIDLPTVGDWIYADLYDDDTHAIIHDVMSRKTLLKRKTAGAQVNFQLIAANIDVAFVIQSADDNFNLRRLERYLVMINESGIIPIILLSKCDLTSKESIEAIIASISTVASQVPVLSFSSLNEQNIEAVKCSLSRGNTYCLLGSSGVGKTTLLNRILGDGNFKTQSVSKVQSKGRHTTTHRELIRLRNGAMIIDTPGMRELGNISVDMGIDETFSEILALIQNCRFSNCSHTSEKGCAILAAIEEGDLSKQRFKNYIKMKKESAFNHMSYSEKRKKEKKFSKLIKSTVKSKNR